MFERRFPRVSDFFGRLLSIDDFQWITNLGKGTFGQVSLYRHKDTNKKYAIKLDNKGYSRQQIETLTRKQLEILYKIDNQHIIKLLDHFEDKDSVYLITQFIEGANLYDQSLKITKKLPLDCVADIIYQTCEGLQELHSNHIIHRDIKLENLMYNNEFIKIVDLGCSNFYSDRISRQTTIGTRFYMSPEILSQEQQNDRVDVWCLGVVLYELLFLEQPFNGADIERKIRKCQYSFPGDQKPEHQLEDLFKRVFTNKNNRLKASQLRKHPWIKKYRNEQESKKGEFEDFFREEQIIKYRQFLKTSIQNNNKSLQLIKPRSDKLLSLLKEAKRELKKR